MDDLALAIGNAVYQKWGNWRGRIGVKHHLAGLWVDLRMGRARVFQRASKVVLTDCLQPGNLDFVRRTTFPQRQHFAMMPNQSRVGTIRERTLASKKLLCQKCEVDWVEDTRIERLVGLVFLLPRRRADPAVAIMNVALQQNMMNAENVVVLVLL